MIYHWHNHRLISFIGESFDEAKSSKQDVFSLSLSCGNEGFDEAKPFKPDTFPHTPGAENPPVCSPADLSPARSVSMPSLSPSVSPLASVPSLEMRLPTPEHFYSENFSPISPEPTRAEIKKSPHAFIHSVFPHSDQAALRDRLREVLCSQWWTEGTPEPRGLLNSFVKRIATKIFECQSCGKKVFTSQYYECFSL
jgi:hypothetical protein